MPFYVAKSNNCLRRQTLLRERPDYILGAGPQIKAASGWMVLSLFSKIGVFPVGLHLCKKNLQF